MTSDDLSLFDHELSPMPLTITRFYNLGSLEPNYWRLHGVSIIFLIIIVKHRLLVFTIYVMSRNKNKCHNLYLKIFIFRLKNLQYIRIGVFT